MSQMGISKSMIVSPLLVPVGLVLKASADKALHIKIDNPARHAATYTPNEPLAALIEALLFINENLTFDPLNSSFSF